MSEVVVRLYTRTNCHLCEQAETWLDELQAEIPHNASGWWMWRMPMNQPIRRGFSRIATG